jgi:hypothetical protein
MAALINALDSHTPVQIGEKGHQEYGWSNSLREKVLQLSFQLTRCDPERMDKLAKELTTTIRDLQSRKKMGQISVGEYVELMTALYKTIGHTRDLIDGKGEYSLAYMQIFVWYNFFPELAKYALSRFVLNDSNEHPYGSWKDVKYFCLYCKSKNVPFEHPLVQFSLDLIVQQIRVDETSETKSLAAKWVPREKSNKFGWMYNELAYSYFNDYIKTANTPTQLAKAQTKCKMSFRKLISRLNVDLDTTQIKQCGQRWAEIDHSKTTSITNSKQKKAFLNIKKDGTQRSDLDDRIQCAEKYKERIKKAANGEVEMKGKRIGMESFAKQARELIRRTNQPEHQTEVDLLNAQWRDNATQTGALGPMIAMLDFSGSMDGDPLHCAMALGCRVAEKSILGKRVMSFSTNPTWHNMDGCDNFYDMIRVLENGEVGYSTNFHKAFDRILDAIIEKKLSADEVSGMILAIFSDMQIDEAKGGDIGSLYEVMEQKYADAGMRLHGTPFKPPHILFWNLRSTSGFPSLSSQKNVSMMSGFNPSLLNLFCEKGLDAFSSCTPWSIFMEMINKPRYKCLENKILEELMP